MRTQLFRGVLALALALAVSAPAFAQATVQGTVHDEKGQPIAGATVVIVAAGTGRRLETQTNQKGEFLQLGLATGSYEITASKDAFKQTQKLAVKAGQRRVLVFELTPTSGLTAEEKKLQSALGSAATEAIAAIQANNPDLAIAKFQEVLAKLPSCGECYHYLGLAYSEKKMWPEAEAAFKKAIEMVPDLAGAYSGLANVYNATARFDLAVATSAKAAQLSGGGAAGVASADALYNQGVTLWNAQKYTEAKEQFEAALKADPKMALAYYQLGMANLNLGQLPAAKEAFQGYLKVDASGPKAAEVQGILKQLP